MDEDEKELLELLQAVNPLVDVTDVLDVYRVNDGEVPFFAETNEENDA